MRLPIVSGVASLCTLLASTAPGAGPGGSRADYERAAGLRKLTEGKVYRDRLEVRWSEDGQRLWYRVNAGPGDAADFALIDLATGGRGPAFDQARLATVLGQTLNRTLDPARLPVDRVLFPADARHAELRSDGRWFAFDLDTGHLTPLARQDPPLTPQAPVAGPRRSARTGAETAIVFANQTPGEIELVWLDPDGQRRSYGRIAAGQQRRQHTFAGHAWLVLDAKGEPLAVYEGGDEPGRAVIDGQPVPPPPAPPPAPPGAVSPDGRWSVRVRDHDLVLRDLQTSQDVALTTDGTADDSYTDRLHWSPDATRLAAVRTRPAQAHPVYTIESSPPDQVEPKLHQFDYLKPGDRIAQDRPCLFDVPQRRPIPVGTDLCPNPWSLDDLRWAPDSSRFTLLYNQRGHQVLRLLAVDARDGSAKPLVEEQTKTFICYSGKEFHQFLDDTHELVWMSERDGWNHLYLYDTLSGQVKNPITHGEWVVRGVDRVDPKTRQVWFRAGGIRPGQDPYYVHYARVNLDGTGLVILTEGDGTHSLEFSPDGRFCVDRWSRVDLPAVTELRRTADGSLVCELERADWRELLKTGWQPPERVVAKGRDGRTDIYGVLWRPQHLDPAGRCPVLENIYAGPQSAFVPKDFHSYYEEQSMAELGFVVVMIDGMGTSHRSKAFHDVCWRNLADSGFPDRIAWLRAAAAAHPYLDLDRVGIYGGSAGGQSALRALLAHGDVYKVAVADCGCHDNRMDKIWWNEQWMGWPVGPHYAEQSNVTQAHRLQGKLLLIVGELDRNVDPASTLQVANALVKADKDFDLLVIPGVGHGAAGTPYGQRRLRDFFVRHLLGVEPRHEGVGL